MDGGRGQISLAPLSKEDRIVIDRLSDFGDTWIVGGWVRDVLSGFAPGQIADMDLATILRPEEVKEIFPRSLMVGEKFGTVIVRIEEPHSKEYQCEVTTLREDGGYSDGRRPENVVFGQEIGDDLGRRDFTINAMAIEPIGKLVENDDPMGKLLDYHGGEDDLASGLLRAVGDAEKRLGEDGLRVIRAFRFLEGGENGIRNLDRKLSNSISSNLEMLDKVSKERIWDEFRKILDGKHSTEIVGMMHDNGVLDKILPGVSVNLVDLHSDGHLVNLALLCSSEEADETILAKKLAENLRLSRKEVAAICLLHGLRDLELDSSIKSVRRFIATLDKSSRSMVVDYLSGSGVEMKIFEEFYQNHGELRAGVSPLMDGNLISSLTGLEAGRKLGRLKDWMHRIQVEEDIENIDDLIAIMDEIGWEETESEDWPQLSWP